MATAAAATPAATGGVDDHITPTTVRPAIPQASASLFVGDLDPAVTEDHIVEAFKAFGTILSVRVCRDMITRRSLGYGYVNFQNHADADRACRTLNYTVIGTRPVRIMWQQRDPALRYSGSGNVFVKGLPESVDSKSLHELFSVCGNILSVKVMVDENGKSRGYGFVHFKEEDAAKQAIEKQNGVLVDPSAPHPLYVAMFIRRNARIAALVQNFTNVYIKNVVPTISRETIEAIFSKFGGITSAVAKLDPKGRAFAFCNFAKHDDALKAIEEFHDHEVDGVVAPGSKLFVQRAQHRSERLIELRQKYMQRQALGNNLYVRNFDPSWTADDLRELFKNFGEITSAKVMADDKGPRGFGFVSFQAAEQANHALKELNGRILNGKPIVVNIAQRRDHRTSMLQVQFQQRIYAMLHNLPMMPFVAAPQIAAVGHSSVTTSGVRAQQQVAAPRPTMRNRGRGGARAQQSRDATAAAPRDSTARSAVAAPAAAAASPQTPPLGPITRDQLESMSTDEQKVALGERLYMKVHAITEDHAPKITGMFLELDPFEILALLEDTARLNSKVDEALAVLMAHGVKVAVPRH